MKQKDPANAAQTLTKLGAAADTTYSFDYDPSVLETFENKHTGNDYFVKFNCPEFTALCPITGQPDFATLYISYIPERRMVESKSLKLYLFSFRNHGAFHEDCVNIIMKDLVKLMKPRYIEVWGQFLPRGGISIDPYCNYGMPGTKYADMASFRLMNHDIRPERVDNR
jgi:7-cyano-7-deazaguanine reductase